MANVVVTISGFRQIFPAFSDTEKYSDAFIQSMLDMAQTYISPQENCLINSATIKNMIYLMTAHLAQINSSLANGKDVGQVSSASVGGVSVSKVVPKNTTELDYWLNTTPYGMQLLATLSSLSAIGLYIGGQKENVFR